MVDPVDGSTNASRRLPWFATSLCAVDADGARAAVVVNQATGERFEAVRGGGARRDGVAIRPSPCAAVGEAIVGISGLLPGNLGWRQFRALVRLAPPLCITPEEVDTLVDIVAASIGELEADLTR